MYEKKHISPGGGLNSDDELRSIPDGDFPCGQLDSIGALNVRAGITALGNNTSIEAVLGNTQVPYTLPVGNNKTIGAKEDELTNTITYFNYNDQNNHTILQYNWSTNVISLVAQGIALGFDVNHKITGINLVQNSDGTYGLYWTDDFTEPHKINLTQAINGQLGVSGTEAAYLPYSPTNLGGVDTANTFTPGQLNLKEYIYAIKTPPLYPPNPVYLTDSTRNSNYMNGFLWQFQYRYIYDDKEKSAPSPISIVPLPDLDSALFTDTFTNNYIQINVNAGSAIVTKIEIWGRKGNTGPMQSLITLVKSDPYNTPSPIPNNSTYQFNFYNDGIYSEVNIPDAINLFDNVPQLAGAQEVIDPTRISYGDAVDGYNQVPIVAELGLSFPARNEQFFTLHCDDVNIMSPTQLSTYGQPIYTLKESASYTTPPVFGGFAADETNKNYLATNPDVLISNYNQIIPLGGFVFYLAGTNNHAISQQVSIPPSSTDKFTQDSLTGIIQLDLTNGTPLQKQINDLNFYVRQNNGGVNRIRSTVSIGNVVPGNYVLRIADHGTTQAELSDPQLLYQKRSTYSVRVGGVDGHELVVKITFDGTNYHAFVNNSEVTIGPNNVINIPSCVILDMSYAANLAQPSHNDHYTNAISGYVLNNDNVGYVPTPGNDSSYLVETRVDLAKVTFTVPSGEDSINLFSSVMSGWLSSTPFTYTDHNGFFFFLQSQGPTSQHISLNQLQSGTIVNGAGSQSNQAGSSLVIGANNWRMFLNTITPTYFNNSRTTVNVKITENNNPLSNIAMVITRGGFGLSTSTGIATVTIFADTSSGQSIRQDSVYYKTEDDTFFDSYIPASDFFNINFGATGSQLLFISPYTGVYNFSFPLNLVSVLATITGKDPASPSLKRGGTYQYGICYYDHANRSGTTNTNDFSSSSTVFSGKISEYGMKLYVPFYTEVNPNSTASPKAIYGGSSPMANWSIFHQPPAWATHYQWVRTKDTAVNRFIQFTADNPQYLDVNFNPTTFDSQTDPALFIALDLSSITDYNKMNPTSTLVYDWITDPDDHVRFIKDNNGNFYNTYIDSLVVGWAGLTAPQLKSGVSPVGGNSILIIENNPLITVDISQQPGLLFEVYNPKLQIPSTESLFWEIGECYPIGVDSATGLPYHTGNGGTFIAADQSTQIYPAGTHGNQSVDYAQRISGITIPTSTTPATGDFIGGDMYYRTRNMPFTGTISGQGSSGFKVYVIEDPSVSDFYLSNISDIGRPNRYDPDAQQLRRPSTIWYSELFVPETNINGLNTFYDTNFETYELKYGNIERLYNENHRLIVYQQLKVGQVPVNQAMVYDQANNQQLVYTENVLNDIIYYEGEYGMTNPESFAVFGSAKYHIDTNRLKPIRLANDGLKPIDENDSRQIKTHTYWSTRLSLYKGVPNIFIYGTYDKKFRNYVVAMEAVTTGGVTTFSAPVTLSNGTVLNNSYTSPVVTLANPETIAWDEQANRWKSKFSFFPDFMCQYLDNIVSFYQGQLYIHNSGTQYNTFYGTTTPSEVDFAGNQESGKQKVLLAISEESAQIWEAEISTEEGQLTHAIAQDFELIENVQYAPVFMNENTPNVANPAIEGEVMRSSNFLVRLTLPLVNAASFAKVFCLNLLYSPSERSDK